MNIFLKIAFIVTMAVNTASANISKSDDRESAPAVAAPAKENKLSKEEIKALKLRLKEIRDIDPKSLTLAQKQELRKEVISIKEELRKSHGVVVISSTLLIIIILLILLL